MGDTYREEKKRNHKKSGFGSDQTHTGNDLTGILEAEARALRRDYFKKAYKPSLAAQRRLF